LILLEAPRRIASNGNRTPAKEVLALKNITQPETQPVQRALFD
jgi:hypothetical protein